MSCFNTVNSGKHLTVLSNTLLSLYIISVVIIIIGIIMQKTCKVQFHNAANASSLYQVQSELVLLSFNELAAIFCQYLLVLILFHSFTDLCLSLYQYDSPPIKGHIITLLYNSSFLWILLVFYYLVYLCTAVWQSKDYREVRTSYLRLHIPVKSSKHLTCWWQWNGVGLLAWTFPDAPHATHHSPSQRDH